MRFLRSKFMSNSERDHPAANRLECTDSSLKPHRTAIQGWIVRAFARKLGSRATPRDPCRSHTSPITSVVKK
jgi:hypothetical protein